MDSTEWSSGEVGEFLSLSTPAVLRAATTIGLRPQRTAGGHRRFTSQQVSEIAHKVGMVPRITGMTRPEVQVLAAIATHPLGLDSARSVARASSVSPTGAARALSSLERRGFVSLEAATVINAGVAGPGSRWCLVVGKPWFQVAERVATTVLPAAPAGKPPKRVPSRFWHLFWNGSPAGLTIERDGGYIATRLVLGPDLVARSWAICQLPAESLTKAATNRAADTRIRAMVNNALRR